MRRLLNIASLLSLITFAHASPVYSLYTKTKSNTFGTWAEESGASVVWLKQGHFSFESNLAVITKLPYKAENVEGYTAGATFRYKFGAHDDAFQPSIYTKVKYDLFRTYQQETGFAGTLWSNAKSRWSLGWNAGLLYTYPLHIHDTAPGYTAGITLSYRL